jgi:cytochrome c oxidase assembly protein subunit 11
MAVQAGLLVGLVAGMLGLAFAAVPLYDLFCRVTGFGGTTQIADGGPSTVIDRPIEVRFDANVAPGLHVDFKPLQRAQMSNLGQTGLAFYRFTNKSDTAVVAMATYNVTPHKVGRYFVKLECFCFQNQVFEPGETVELPVVYFVAPELASDRETEEVRSITLSYTFFEAVNPDETADARLGGLDGAS